MKGRNQRYSAIFICIGLGLTIAFLWLFALDEKPTQAAVSVASLSVNKTVGTNANACAVTDVIEVGPGTAVTYCYEVTNTGTEILDQHNLVDDQLGEILTNFPYNLAPGASAFLTQTVVVSESVTNIATWSARTAGGVVASDDDSAQVVVVPPSLELVKTVGLEANVCASTEQVEISPGTRVTYCYEVTNTGIEALDQHTLIDDQLGRILLNFPYNLMPGASAFLTHTVVLSQSVTNIATWSAQTSSGVDASDEDTAQVVVIPPAIELVKTVGLDASACAVSDVVDITAGTQVTYCYTVRNTGITNLVTHHLVDDQLGVILSDFPYHLVPGASVFLTQTVTISNTVINEATWTGITASGIEAAGIDTARVNVEGDGLFDLFLPAINR